MTAEHRPNMTPNALVDAIDRFISDNRHSSYVEHRWFAGWLAEALTLARLVRNDNLSEGYKAQVAAFRLAEVEAEKERRHKEIDQLEREAQTLRVAAR